MAATNRHHSTNGANNFAQFLQLAADLEDTDETFSGSDHDDDKDSTAAPRSHSVFVPGDRMLCLSGNSHAGLAFQCGVLVALQELGQLQRVGIVSATGTGCMLAGALSSLWRHTTRPVPEEERTRPRHETRSWSSITTRDVATTPVYESTDTKSNDVLALRGSGLIQRNELLVNNICEPMRHFVGTPHEWNVFRKRICNPIRWLRSYNHEMIPAIYHRFGLGSIRAGLTIPDLCVNKQYSNEPIVPIFNFTARSSHTDRLVVISNTGLDTVREPPDGRITGRLGIDALGLPLAGPDQDLSRILASIALPGPGPLLRSLEWHECEELKPRLAHRLTLANASLADPLGVAAAQMWFEQLRHESDASDTLSNECLFVVDAYTHSPLFDNVEETDQTYRRTTENQLHELMTPASDGRYDRACCVNLEPIQCFDPRVLDFAVSHRQPVLEMNEVHLPSDSKSKSKEPCRRRRYFDSRLTQIPEWYECMRPFFGLRMTALPAGAFKALANWGYLLTFYLHATDVQFDRFQRRDTLLYETLPSDSKEDEQLLNGFGLRPSHILFTPTVDDIVEDPPVFMQRTRSPDADNENLP